VLAQCVHSHGKSPLASVYVSVVRVAKMKATDFSETSVPVYGMASQRRVVLTCLPNMKASVRQ
jgi:hypothetical protein